MSEDKKQVGYMWRIGAQTADGIQTDITGNFPLDADDDVINSTLDRFYNIFSRQRARTMLLEEENTLKKERAELEEARATLSGMSQAEAAGTKERKQLDAMKQGIDSLEARIKARKQGVESLKQLVNPAP